jgi:hypothetical protein
MQESISRRTVIAGALAGAAGLVLSKPGVLAQDATPASASISSMFPDYPVLEVTVTDSAVEVGSTTIPTGNVVLRVTNASSMNSSAGMLGPGEGQTMDDLKASMATPIPDDEFPALLYQAVVLGGPTELQPGQTGEALIAVTAGDWVVFPEGSQAPAFVTAADSPDSNTTDPTAQLEVTVGDFYFKGLDNVPAGPAIWKVTSEGKQPHMIAISQVPNGTTFDQIMATVQFMGTGTPVAGSLQESDFGPANAGLLMLSSGKSCWVPADLDEGTYVALCFVTDPATHQPHVMEGMVNLFTVGGGAATPTS